MLIFSPLVGTLGTLEESRHRLIGRSDLQLEKVCLVVTARVHWTLSCCLIDIVPGTITSQNIINFLSR